MFRPNRYRYTPLLRAIEEKKEDLVRWMCLYSNHEKADSVLSMANNQEKRNWQVLKIYRHRYHEARLTRA